MSFSRSAGKLWASSAASALCIAALPAFAADDFLTRTPSISIVTVDAAGDVFFNNAQRAYRWNASGVTDLTPTGATQSSIGAITPDGAVVAGTLGNRAAIWRGSAITYLGVLDPTASTTITVTAISDDGAIVAGRAYVNSGNTNMHAFRWKNGVMSDLGTLPGTSYSGTTFLSADGSVVVGYSQANGNLPWRWENGQMVALFAATTGNYFARMMSTDGTVIAGAGDTGNWRWVGNSAGGTLTEGINYLPGSTSSSASAMSSDGSVVAGYGVIGTNAYAFRWVNGVSTQLPSFSGDLFDVPSAMTPDGKVIVGYVVDSSSHQRAVRWTDALGIQSIADLLAKGGVDTTGWTLQNATDISADGTVIIGSGIDANRVSGTWIAHCTSACAVISSDVIGQSFSGEGALTGTAATYLGSQFDEAGHMADAGKDGSITGFASGAFDSDPTTSAAIGAAYNLGNDLVLGGSLGAAGILTNTPYNGSATFSGPSLTSFLASRPDEGANWLIGGSLVGLSGTVTRGYFNGNTPVTSTGSTTGTGAAFTAEAGWTFKDLVANTLVTPFVSATISSISYAGYTETGGPFLATFSAISATAATFRVGAEGRYAFSKDSALTARIAYAHTFGNGPTITGAIPGILALSVPGASAPTDMLEAGVGIDLPIKDKIRANARLGVTIPLSGSPSLQASAGVSMAF